MGIAWQQTAQDRVNWRTGEEADLKHVLPLEKCHLEKSIACTENAIKMK